MLILSLPLWEKWLLQFLHLLQVGSFVDLLLCFVCFTFLRSVVWRLRTWREKQLSVRDHEKHSICSWTRCVVRVDYLLEDPQECLHNLQRTTGSVLPMYPLLKTKSFCHSSYGCGPHDVGSDPLHFVTVLSLPVVFPVLEPWHQVWHQTCFPI